MNKFKRWLLALATVVVATTAVGGAALARSGSDSSGTHSYSLSCDGDSAVFSNTSVSGNLRVSGGGNSFILAPGGPGGLLDWEGGWSIEFEDPHGSGNWMPLDSGSEGPDDICAPPVFPEPPEGVSYTLECAEMDATSEGIEHVFTNTGTIDLRIIVSLAMGQPGYNVAAGGSVTIYGRPGAATNSGTKIRRCRVATEGSERGDSPTARKREPVLPASARAGSGSSPTRATETSFWNRRRLPESGHCRGRLTVIPQGIDSMEAFYSDDTSEVRLVPVVMCRRCRSVRSHPTASAVAPTGTSSIQDRMPTTMNTVTGRYRGR